jgi:hypothetical protein
MINPEVGAIMDADEREIGRFLDAVMALIELATRLRLELAVYLLKILKLHLLSLNHNGSELDLQRIYESESGLSSSRQH